MQHDDSMHTIHEWETTNGANWSRVLTLAPKQAIAPTSDSWGQELIPSHHQSWWSNPYAVLVWLGLADYL
jgi:hypothetical protein